MRQITHHVHVIQRGATKTNSLESHMARHPHGPVCLFRQLSCLFVAWLCMNQRQRVVMSNHSVFVQKCLCQSLTGVWKIKTRKLVGEKRVEPPQRGEGTGTQTHKCTPAGRPAHTATQHPASHQILSADWFWSVGFFFKKRHHIGGPLLCSASAHWWHHSVWEVAAIFSLRQCAAAADSPASAQGMTQRETRAVWRRIRLS